MKTLKKGTFEPNYPIENLKYAKVNRDMMLNHAESLKRKLIDYGWMMPIVASKTGDVIEGHHRVESAKMLKQKTVPVYIPYWVNTKKPKEHLDCIINLNNGNKSWSMLNYLKTFATKNKHILYKRTAFKQLTI